MGWGKSLWESMPQGEAHSLPEGPPGKLVTDQHLCPVLSPTMFLLPGWSWSWPVTSRYAFPPRPGWDPLPPPPQTSLPLCSLASAWKPCSDLDPRLSWPLPPGTPSSRSAQLSSCPPSPLPCHSSSLDHPGVQETPAVSTSQALKSRAHLDSSADGRFRGVGLGGSQEGSYHTKTCQDAPALDTDKL